MRLTIGGTLTVNAIEDGAAGSPAPSYHVINYAWSSDLRTASTSIAPTVTETWQPYIPEQTAAYLWERNEYYEWNGTEYVLRATTYARVTGESGTGFQPKGHVADYGSLPTTDLTVGDAYLVEADGHLYVWNGSSWQDFGEIKGDNGLNSYVHIAWAHAVGSNGYPTGGNPEGSAMGFTVEKLPTENFEYMGILTDNILEDSHNPQAYQWTRVNGSVYVDLDNDNDTMLYSGDRLISGNVTSQATLYVGGVPVSQGVSWRADTSNVTATIGTSTGLITVTALTGNSGWVLATAAYGGSTYSAKLSIKRSEGDKYDILPSVKGIGYNITDNLPATSTVSFQIRKTDITGEQTLLTAVPSGMRLTVNGSTSGISHTQNTNTWSFTTNNSAQNNYRIELRSGGSPDYPDLEDGEDIPIIKASNGAGGADAMTLMLTPSVIYAVFDYSGLSCVADQDFAITAHVKVGGNDAAVTFIDTTGAYPPCLDFDYDGRTAPNVIHILPEEGAHSVDIVGTVNLRVEAIYNSIPYTFQGSVSVGMLCNGRNGGDGRPGKNSVRLDLDNEMDSIQYGRDGTKLGGQVITKARLYDGSTLAPANAVTFGDIWTSGDATGKTVPVNCTATKGTLSDGVQTYIVETLTANEGTLTVRATYNGVTYEKVFTVKKLIGRDKYALVIYPDAVPFNPDTQQHPDLPIRVQINHWAPNGGYNQMSTLPSNVKLYANPVTTEGVETENPVSSSFDRGMYVMEEADINTNLYGYHFIIKEEVNNIVEVQDQETVPIARVWNGESNIYADLSNEMDAVAMTNDGKVMETTVLSTSVNMFYGSQQQTLSDITWGSNLPSGVTVEKTFTSRNPTGVRVTVNANTELPQYKLVIPLTAAATINGTPTTKTVDFTISGVRAGASGTSPIIYQLNPSDTAIKKDKNGTLTPDTITCTKLKRNGNSEPMVVTDSDVSIYYKIDNGREEPYPSTGVSTSGVTNSIKFILRQGNGIENGTVIDRESVPVVEDGQDGDEGPAGQTFPYHELHYALSQNATSTNASTAPGNLKPPSPGQEQWSTAIPDADAAYPYLWMRDTYHYGWNGSSFASQTVTYSMVTGSSGAGSVRLDIDNEMDSMQYMSTGTGVVEKVIPGSVVEGHVRLYDGTDDVTSQATEWDTVYSGCSDRSPAMSRYYGGTNGYYRVVVYSMTDAKGTATVSCKYKGTTYAVVFSVVRLVDAEKYELRVFPDAISYNETTGELSSESINVQVWSTNTQGVTEPVENEQELAGKGLSIIVENQDGRKILPSTDYEAGQAEYYIRESDSQYVVYLKDVNDVLQDVETIPINRVENGNDAVVYSIRSIDEIRVPSDATSTTLTSLSISTYRRVGNGSDTTRSAYYAFYWLTGSTYKYYGATTIAAASITLTNNSAQNIPKIPSSFPTTYDAFVVVASQMQITSTADALPGTYLVKKEIRIRKDGDTGGPGENAVRIDLTNQADMVACNAEGKVLFARDVSTTVRIYDGASPALSGVSWGKNEDQVKTDLEIEDVKPDIIAPDINDGSRTITWHFTTEHTLPASVTKQIALSYKGKVYTADFTLGVTNSTAIYQLAPSPDAISLERGADGTSFTGNDIDMSFDVIKTDASGSEKIGARNDMAIYWGYDDSVSYTNQYKEEVGGRKTFTLSNLSQHSNIVLELWNVTRSGSTIIKVGNQWLDKETIPITKDGEKGQKGNKGDNAVSYRILVTESSATINARGRLNATVKFKVIKNEGGTDSEVTINSSALNYTGSLYGVYRLDTESQWHAANRSGTSLKEAIFTYTDIPFSGTKPTSILLGYEPENNNIVATASVPIAITGQMGRNFYYAGVWNANTIYEVTDLSAPFVEYIISGENIKRYYVLKADNGKYCGVSSGTATITGVPSDNTKDYWEQMTSNFNYLITKAVFTDFAQLGSAVFNGDYMFSQQGYVIGYLNERTYITDNSQFQYVDPNDMDGENMDENNIWWDDYDDHGVTVVNGTPFNMNRDGLLTLERGRYYSLYVKVSGLAGQEVRIAVTNSNGTILHPYYKDVVLYADPQELAMNFRISTSAGVNVRIWNMTSGSTLTLEQAGIRATKFTPALYMNLLTGQMVANNLTARGMLYASSVGYTKIVGSRNNETLFVGDASFVTLKSTFRGGSQGGSAVVILPDPATCKGRVIEIFKDTQNGGGGSWRMEWENPQVSAFYDAFGVSSFYFSSDLSGKSYIKLLADVENSFIPAKPIWRILKAESVYTINGTSYLLNV